MQRGEGDAAGEFHFLENAETCQGYEIHMGETRPVPGEAVVPLNKLEDGGEDGCL